jgi:hypothetical protein
VVGKGSYTQEDDALRDVIATFEQETGKPVELILLGPTKFADEFPGDPDALAWYTLLDQNAGPRALYRLNPRRS